MNEQGPSQVDFKRAVEAAPSWLLSDHYASKTLRALAEITGPDGSAESVDHRRHSFDVTVDQLYQLLLKAPHKDEDESFAIEVAGLARRLVRDIPFSYPADSISEVSRQSLLTLANRIEANELELEIRARKKTLAELDDAATKLSESYHRASESLKQDVEEWSQKLDEWNKELNPKAAELAGQHLNKLLREQQARTRRVSYAWLVAAILGFVATAAVAVVLVLDISSVAGRPVGLRSSASEHLAR